MPSSRAMKTVLVIDDDAGFRKQITQWLGEAGWCVLEAADGENGIHLAIELKPEAVICSLHMPGSNGFQICRSIRERAGVIEQPKIIVTTGSVYATDRRSAITQAGSMDATAILVMAKEEPHVTTSTASVIQSLVVTEGFITAPSLARWSVHGQRHVPSGHKKA